MSKTLIVIIVVLAIVGGLWYALPGLRTNIYTPYHTPAAPSTSSNLSTPSTPQGTYSPPAMGQGRVVFAIKDAAHASLQGATSIMVTVDKIEAHSATQDWIIVSTAQKKYDLLQLKQSGSAALLADANLPVDTYDQIRLNIRTVEVVTTTNIAREAKLPSHVLKLVGRFTTAGGKISAVTIDFLADKSLHVTGNGIYILAPVVKLETRSGTKVEVKADESVAISGGKVEEEKNAGMDEKGEMKPDFELKGNLDIDAGDMIRIKNGVRAQGDITLSFASPTSSTFFGTATLHEAAGKVNVTLKLDTTMVGPYAPPEPAHIHAGSCPDVGAVKYPLATVVNGNSETTLNTSLAHLKIQLPLAINVHKSSAQPDVYIACADIKF